MATLSVFAELSVPPLLYHIVFGESVLNDAVCLLEQAFAGYQEALYCVSASDVSHTHPLLLYYKSQIWVMYVVIGLQVAIVLFRTLVEFYDRPLGLTTLPLIIWRFATIGVGSILTGRFPPSNAAVLAEAWS